MIVKTILSAFSVLVTLNAFGQYYSKVYDTNLISIIKPYENTVIHLEGQICDNDLPCLKISRSDGEGAVLWEQYKPDIVPNHTTLTIRNDTIFYTGRSNVFPDSMYVWYFGMMTVAGDSIAEYQIPMLHARYGNALVYGLTLTGGNEAILWGEGVDNRMPAEHPSPYRSMFIRIGFDGDIPGDIFWHQPNVNGYRRMSDVWTDIDGHVVFVTNFEGTGGGFEPGAYGAFYKIWPNDSISLERHIPIGTAYYMSPKMAIDQEGNYYTAHQVYWEKVEDYIISFTQVSYISKIANDGTVQWKKLIPPFDGISSEIGTHEAIQQMKVNRISVCQNGDILAVGNCYIIDTVYNRELDSLVYVAGWTSFMVRMTTDGEVVWRHLIVDLVPYRSYYMRGSNLLDIREADDGSIYVSGRLDRATESYPDGWVMRLNADGCLEDECTYFDKFWLFPLQYSDTEDIRIADFTVYPNPSHDIMTISIPDEVYDIDTWQYSLYDLTGQIVKQGKLSGSMTIVDTDGLAVGLYMLRIYNRIGHAATYKWVKM